MSNQSPFVVDRLQPQGGDGRSRGVYQLTASSVHPTRVIGRDEYGMPTFETVPTVNYREFVTASGCINKVPVRTCSVADGGSDGQNYEQMITNEKVQAGWIPLSLCPHSTAYTHLTNGPFVPLPAGEEACADGSVPHGGCHHMRKLMKMRQERALARHNTEVERFESMDAARRNAEVQRLRDGIVEGVGAVIAQHASGQESRDAGRNRLRNAAAKSEE